MKSTAGHLHDIPYIGRTLPEHGLGDRGVHLDASHYLSLASSGSGKLLTSAGHQLIGWPYDMIVITQKEDLCNTSLGRRSSPRLHDDVSLARKWGRRLGIDARKITKTRFHLPGGRTMNVDFGGSTAYSYSRYTFLSDVDLNRPGAMARLMAIVRGLFPDQKPNATSDPYWTLAPQGAFAGVCGHVLSTESDPRKQTLVHATERLLGIDPSTGRSHPKNQDRLFKEMMCNPTLGGFVAAQGAELFNLGDKTLGPLMSTIGTRTRFMLADPRIRDILTGPSDFSIDEFGRGVTPLTCYVTPVRGDKSTEALLRMFLELSVLFFQGRDFVPENPVMMICDEVPAWGEEQVHTLRRALNILRDKKIVCWLYAQSASQLIDIVGEEGLNEMLSASLLQVFGVRDKRTGELIRDRLGRTTIRRKAGRRSDAQYEEVFVADLDAIYDELAPGSPIQYVVPYSGRPIRLERSGIASVRTREGLNARGLAYEGHFDVGLRTYRP